MDYFPMSGFEWSTSNKMDIRPSTIFNASDWGIRYDVGSLFKDSALSEWCKHNLNEQWLFAAPTKKSKDQAPIKKKEKGKIFLFAFLASLIVTFGVFAFYACQKYKS